MTNNNNDGDDITNTDPVKVSCSICDYGPSYCSIIIASQWPMSCQCLYIILNVFAHIIQCNCGGLDDHLLPTLIPDWDIWHRTAFEQGNSPVFLKLVTWMFL
jgi:hypothetical protein